MGVLTSTEHKGYFHAVAAIDKVMGVAELGLVVVVTDIDVEFNLFELGCNLFLLLLFFLLLLLKLELAVVHNTADGRRGGSGDFYKIKTCFVGTDQCLTGRYDSHLLAVFVDTTNFGHADHVVHSWTELSARSVFVIRISDNSPLWFLG